MSDYTVPEAIEALGYDAACPPYLVHRACILMVHGGIGTEQECKMARAYAAELYVPCGRLSVRCVMPDCYGDGDGDGDGDGGGYGGYGNGYGNGGYGGGDGYGYGDGDGGDGDGDGNPMWVTR